MSITDELREWFKDRLFMGNGYAELTAIADRIDAEHERMLGDWDYWESTHVELPKDADGEYVHFGDVMEWRHPCGSCELRHGIVTGIKTDKIGDEVFHEVTINADRFSVRLMASELRHHRAPTVEDVLREFALAVCKDEALTIRKGVVEEFAAKLRLAEGEDA